jgi:hypothetical protein
MVSTFLADDRIVFLAGRHFTHGGNPFVPGEEITNAREWHNLESAVRSRYLVPVVEDLSVLPLRLQKEVKVRSSVEEKLNYQHYLALKPEPVVEPEPVFDYPGDHKIAEILEYLDVHPEETHDVLEREREGKNRVRLITELEERLTAPEETIDV